MAELHIKELEIPTSEIGFINIKEPSKKEIIPEIKNIPNPGVVASIPNSTKLTIIRRIPVKFKGNVCKAKKD